MAAFWYYSTIHSYGQLFFSKNKFLILLIILVTFFNPFVGFGGLLAIVLVNTMAKFLGFNEDYIKEGVYGFNALLLGLALCHNYESSFPFWFLFLFSCLLLLVVTVGINALLIRFAVPFLSLPFLFTFWIISLASSSFSTIHANELQFYTANYSAVLNQNSWMAFWNQLDTYLDFPQFLITFFKTLSGILFQNSIFGGVLVTLGVLVHSRISFSLCVLGFYTAYFFYSIFGVDVLGLNYHLVGANYIFMAISLGSFYIIPNFYSYAMVFILTPLLMMLLISSNKFLALLNLNGFTFAFTLIVIGVIYFLNQRWLSNFLHAVEIQYYAPEKSVYNFRSALKRFRYIGKAKFKLPFWGKWQVSQGYDGAITHLGLWSKALDFVIVDNESKTYQGNGLTVGEFYCYNKPVLAPADGYVYNIIAHVDDNEIADVNTEDNWGNTIILNHLNGIFSQISHLKKESIKVAIGEYVTIGTVLATVGNTGRSPEPHIHFQFQLDPKVGAATYAYPISYFIENDKLKIYDTPTELSVIQNVETTTILTNCFDFKPGNKIKFSDTNSVTVEWEVFTDAWNLTYFYCHQSKAVAYFINDGTLFYFTEYIGKKNTALFQFYISAYKILLGVYPEFKIEDQFPIPLFKFNALSWIQDFCAPFVIFTKYTYQSKVHTVNNDSAPEKISIISKVEKRFLGYKYSDHNYLLCLKDNKIESFGEFSGNDKTKYLCVS